MSVTTSNLNQLQLSILQSGLDDWISLAVADAAGVFYASDPATVKKDVEAALRGLTLSGALEIGDLSGPKGFSRSTEPAETALRSAMTGYQHAVETWAFSVWFNNTAQGDQLANAAPKTEYHEADEE